MNRYILSKRGLPVWALLLLTVLASARALAFDVTLYSGEFDLTLPGMATPVRMWGYSTDGVNFSSPGPEIVVTSPDTTLNITLVNQLAVSTSIIIPGLAADGMAPVKEELNGKMRITSFDRTAASGGGSMAYTFQNVRPGVYIYHSGTHPALQVQMGLYGAVRTQAGYTGAMPGADYDVEQTLVFSEIDPAVHQAVLDGSYGTLSMPSANEYKPRYFLVNGKTFNPQIPTIDLGAAAPGRTLLLRLVNAGLNDHVPAFGARYATLVAEDAYPLAYPRQMLAVHLAPQKTKDVLIDLPDTDQKIVVYDRKLNLTDNNMSGPGGMMVSLSTGGGGAVQPYDLNGDGSVNASDILAILSSSEFGRGDCSPGNPCAYDLNGDGQVGIRDIAIIRQNFN